MTFNEDEYDDAIKDMFDQLVETGSLIIDGYDEFGEAVYVVTEKCRELFPDFYYSHQRNVNEITFDLWSLGVVDVSFEDDSTMVSFKKHNLEKFFEVENELTSEQVAIVDSFMTRTSRELARKFIK